MSLKQFSPVTVVLIVAAVAAVAASFFLGRFAFDDLYISFRYAEHLADGHGLRWNLDSAPVEGYTNFLLVLILTGFKLIGLDLLISVQVFNLLLTIATAGIIARLAEDLIGDVSITVRTTASILSGLIFIANPYTWQNALSGLETTLFTFLLLFSLWSLWNAKKNRGTWFLGFLSCFLLVLTRPEGTVFGVIATIAFALHHGDRSRVLVWSLLAFVLPSVLFEVWRLNYFGQPLPNTFYVKVSQAFFALPGRVYVKAFAMTELMLLFMLLLGIWKLTRNQIFWTCVIWCIGLTLFYLFANPIQGFYYRFLFSVIALGGMLAVCALVRYTARLKETYRWVLLSSLLIAHLSINWSQAKGEEVQAVIPEATEMYQELGTVLRSIPGADTLSFAYQDAGVVPYYSGLKHYDLVGLNDRTIARSSIEEAVNYLRKESPEIILLPAERPQAGDSCWTIFRQGHGKMGKLGPAMLTSGMLAEYDVVGKYLYIGYDILILVHRASPAQEGIAKTMTGRSYRYLVFSGSIPCLK